jgi:hypothetical protein
MKKICKHLRYDSIKSAHEKLHKFALKRFGKGRMEWNKVCVDFWFMTKKIFKFQQRENNFQPQPFSKFLVIRKFKF